MKVLMISTDRGLAGGNMLGDAIERHNKYGESIDRLDIIVYSHKKDNLNEFKISDKVIGYPTNSLNKLMFFLNAMKLGKKLFEKNNYNLIVSQDPFMAGFVGYRLKEKFKSKLLVHFHGDFWDNQNWLKERWFNFALLKLSKFVVDQSNAVRVMSQGQKDKLKKFGGKVRVISVPVDLEKYNNPNLKLIEEVRALGSPIILHIGRDDKVKDYKTLSKAIKLVKEEIKTAQYWQIGSKIKAWEAAKEEGIKIDFPLKPEGWMSSSELINRYHMSDVVVLSSISESFGKVLVEANAAGKPVISTLTTGAKEIIEHGKNGFFVSIGDAQALANKILYLLNNPDKAKEIGENGRKLVKEKYGDNTSKIINFWQEIVNDKIEINYKNNKLIINYSIRQGTGDTILYLHGLGCSKEDFDPIVNSNRFKNYNLVSFDFPGCGSTPYPKSLDLTIDDLVEITDAFVYNLKLNNFVLIGHSMGGLVGLLYSEKFSSKVKSFINVEGNLDSKDCFFSREVIGKSFEEFKETILTSMKEKVATKFNKGFQRYLRHLEVMDPKAYYDYSLTVVSYSADGNLLERFVKLSMPKLFIYGTKNKDLNYLSYLKENNCPIAEIPNSDHWPIYDNPDDYFEVISKFLQQ